MRIVFKGGCSTEELSTAFELLISRLASAGVVQLSDVIVELIPDVSESAIVFVHDDQSGTLASHWDVFDLTGTAGAVNRALTVGNFVPEYEIRGTILRDFLKALPNPAEFRRSYFSMADEKINDILQADRVTELSRDERHEVWALAELARVALGVFPNRDELAAWFEGPFPHSRFDGATPLQQIQIGGSHVAVCIAESLAAGFWRRSRNALVPWPPPRHFDFAFGRPRASWFGLIT
jgi:hypothetical protein